MFERLLKAINKLFDTTFDEQSNNVTDVAVFFENAQKPNEKIQDSIKSLGDQIASLGEKLDESNRIIKELGDSNQSLLNKVDELKSKNEELVQESKRLTDENSRLAAEINTMKQAGYNAGGSNQEVNPLVSTTKKTGSTTINGLVLKF